MGNEYAQAVRLQLPTGAAQWICNVYLPPTQNLARRGVLEEVARDGLQDVMVDVPRDAPVVVCGDFNARVGNLAPVVRQVQLPRDS